MISALLLLALSQATDVPLNHPDADRTPVLIDEHGSISRILGTEPLPPGTTCLTYPKAVSLRDDLVASHAKLDVYEASQPNWALILGVSAGVAVVVGAVAFGVGYGLKK